MCIRDRVMSLHRHHYVSNHCLQSDIQLICVCTVTYTWLEFGQPQQYRRRCSSFFPYMYVCSLGTECSCSSIMFLQCLYVHRGNTKLENVRTNTLSLFYHFVHTLLKSYFVLLISTPDIKITCWWFCTVVHQKTQMWCVDLQYHDKCTCTTIYMYIAK